MLMSLAVQPMQSSKEQIQGPQLLINHFTKYFLDGCNKRSFHLKSFLGISRPGITKSAQVFRYHGQVPTYSLNFRYIAESKGLKNILTAQVINRFSEDLLKT